jgi:thymidylate synthase ThyX
VVTRKKYGLETKYEKEHNMSALSKEGIKATIIKDSVSPDGVRMTTFELEYPRFIHQEVLTHRMLSKNCASSRAIPVERMLELVRENPAMPVWWGKNQPGMSAKEELLDSMEVKQYWKNASVSMADVALYMSQLGLHKQIANRITEPWQRMKTVISGTEWANLLWLRDHEDAQPEFAVLARCIAEEFNNNTPVELKKGQWHLPYVESVLTCNNNQIFYNGDEIISLIDARKVSASCCAQVSYRRLDDSLEKSIAVFDRLVGATRVHASPFEHQATPMDFTFTMNSDGVTHKTRDNDLWSGNLREWIQYRQLIDGHCKW